MRLTIFIKEERCPDCKDGEWPIRFAKRQKVRDLNKKTNRMKNFKRVRWFKTEISPEERSLKNLPRYADDSPKCTFMEWLGIKGGGCDGAKGYDGRYYGWSHRAIASFGVGDVIKGDMIGNKVQYSDDAQKKYWGLWDKEGSDTADKYFKSLQDYEPYTIKTEQEAKDHAIRFGKDIS